MARELVRRSHTLHGVRSRTKSEIENLWELLKEVYGDPVSGDWEITQTWLISRPYRNYEIYGAEIRRGNKRGVIEYHERNGKIIYVKLIGFTRGLAPQRIRKVCRRYGIKVSVGVIKSLFPTES